MPRRLGRPGLVGTMARTAVIAGTATAVSGNVQRNAAQKQQAAFQASQDDAAQAAAVQESQAQIAAMQAQMAAMQTPAAPAAAPASNDLMAQLTQLAQLKNAGILSEEEFTAAKAKLLAS